MGNPFAYEYDAYKIRVQCIYKRRINTKIFQFFKLSLFHFFQYLTMSSDLTQHASVAIHPPEPPTGGLQPTLNSVSGTPTPARPECEPLLGVLPARGDSAAPTAPASHVPTGASGHDTDSACVTQSEWQPRQVHSNSETSSTNIEMNDLENISIPDDTFPNRRLSCGSSWGGSCRFPPLAMELPNVRARCAQALQAVLGLVRRALRSACPVWLNLLVLVLVLFSGILVVAILYFFITYSVRFIYSVLTLSHVCF